MTRICCCSHSAQHTAHTLRAISSPSGPGSTRPAPSRVWWQRTQVRTSGTKAAEATKRRVAEGGAPHDVVERDRAEHTTVRRVIGAIADDETTTGSDLRDALQEQTRAFARIAHQHDLTGTGQPARRENDDPLPLPQRRPHALA